MKRAVLFFYLIVLSASNLCSQQNDFPKLTGPYLGQKPPRTTPDIFAPGIVATDMNEHSPAAFSPDGKELFWSATNGDRFFIYQMKDVDGVWTKPIVAEFTKGLDATNPVFSVDGEKLFFTSQIVENNKWHITLHYVEKTKDGWSQPKKVDSITNFGGISYQVSFSKDGTIYFSAEREGDAGSYNIYKAKFVNGEFSKPEKLDRFINSELPETSVYIAPDESYIIFRRYIRVENDVLMDFYISFKKDGSWTEPICFTDKLEAKGGGFWIGLSPDQKYIFFVKKEMRNQYINRSSEMFWVDAVIIEELRPKK